jgi:hypothetical protein
MSKLTLAVRRAADEQSESGVEQADASNAMHHLRRGEPLLRKERADL